MKEKLKQFLIVPGHYKLLSEIGNGMKKKYALNISKKINVTYSHTCKLVQIFKDQGLIKDDNCLEPIFDTRRKTLGITKKGRAVLESLDKINDRLGIIHH